MKPQLLFIASCVALVTTSMSFAIRGDIMGDFENVHVLPSVMGADAEVGAAATAEQSALVKTNLGVIGGAAFFSFGLAIVFGGPLCDLLGMGMLLRIAAACHIGGAALTIFAPRGAFTLVVIATLIVGVGNGLVEAVCNPLIATLFPDDKTRKLTLFHAWFPGGVVIGGLLSYGLTEMGYGPGSDHGWQIKMALLLIPAVIYTVMILGAKFPATERVASGVPFSDMIVECVRRPLFITLFIVMWLTAATELGPGTWIANIFNEVVVGAGGAGILLLVWGNGLMYVLRQFATGFVHRFTSPVGLIAITAPLAAIGLYLTSIATTPFMWFVSTGFLFVGVCWWWPTMLGITSERIPRSGALGLAIIGGVGSFSTSAAGPVMGFINDKYGADKVLPIWAALPVGIFAVFVVLFLYDKSKGGYKLEKIEPGLRPNPLEAPVE